MRVVSLHTIRFYLKDAYTVRVTETSVALNSNHIFVKMIFLDHTKRE